MNKRLQLFLLILLCLILTAVFVVKTAQKPVYKKGVSASYDAAVASAITLYKNMAGKIDFTNGPCLTNDLMPDWVVDIVHTPRGAIDDLSQNQCSAYLEGRAYHFVELDLNGNLVRVR